MFWPRGLHSRQHPWTQRPDCILCLFDCGMQELSSYLTFAFELFHIGNHPNVSKYLLYMKPNGWQWCKIIIIWYMYQYYSYFKWLCRKNQRLMRNWKSSWKRLVGNWLSTLNYRKKHIEYASLSIMCIIHVRLYAGSAEKEFLKSPRGDHVSVKKGLGIPRWHRRCTASLKLRVASTSFMRCWKNTFYLNFMSSTMSWIQVLLQSLGGIFIQEPVTGILGFPTWAWWCFG